MSVVPLVEREDATPEVQAAYDESAEYFGEIMDAFKAIGHVPGSVDPIWKLHKILMFEGTIDPVVRTLAVLKMGALNEATYWGPHHTSLGVGELGITEEQMAALDDYEGNPLFTPEQQLVLKYVEETSVTRKTSDEVEEELGKHFNDAERVELALIVGLWNMTNRIFNTLRVDPETFVDPAHKELMYSTFGKQGN